MSNSLKPMDCSMPGLPVQHQLPELAQSHVHWVGDAIQPSYLLSSPSPPAFNLSQGLFQWVGSSHQVSKYWSFNLSISPSSEYSELIYFRTDWFDLLAVQGALKSQVALFWRPQYKRINSSALSFLLGPTLTSIHYYRKKHGFDYMDLCQQSNVSVF